MKKLFKIGTILAGATLLLVLVLDFGNSSSSSAAAGDTTRPGKAKSQANFYPGDPMTGAGEISPASLQAQLRAVPKERLLEDYLSWAKYPPHSRPLEESHVDQLNPRQITLTEQRMPVADGDELLDSGYACLLQPLAHSVYENEVMLITLSCRKEGSKDRAALDITGFRAEGRAGEFLFEPQKPEVGDNGRNGDEEAGDGVYTFQFKPDADDWGDIFLSVTFYIKGDDTGAAHSLRTHFFSSPEAPARFTGIASEIVRDGSLFIEVELEVFEAGSYHIAGNLFAGALPVAAVKASKQLSSGKQTMELEFFGKILFDKDLDGPYTLRDVRGHLNTDAIQPEMLMKPPEEVKAILSNITRDQPSKKMMGYYNKPYKTTAYQAGQFSPAEYESEAKERQIALIEGL